MKPYRILVVDDEEIVRTGLTLDLEGQGFSVLTAASGEEALSILAREGCDLVLTDLMMDGMPGLTLLRTIREKMPEIPVVVITGHGSTGNAVEALHQGAADYIQKPARAEEISHRIRAALDAAQLRRNMNEQRRKADERNRRQHARLARRLRIEAMSSFAAVLASELERSLQVLETAPLPEVKDGDSGALPSFLKAAGQACGSVHALLSQLREFGRVVERQAGTDRVDLAESLRAALESPRLMEARLLHPQAAIEKDAGQPGLFLQGSQTEIETVFVTLIENAVRRLPGGGSVRIGIEVEHNESEEGRWVVVKIRDSGPAWTAEDLERFFDPFYVPQALTERMSGGLELARTYLIIHSHDGFFQLSSRSGAANEIALYLPVCEVCALASELGAGDRPEVLLVEDSAEQRAEAFGILVELGFRPHGVASGRSAVEFIQRRRRDNLPPMKLVVLDLVLGDDFDGVETFKRLVEIEPEIAAVLASGFAETGRIIEGRNLGVRATIQKPYSMENLGPALLRALEEN